VTLDPDTAHCLLVLSPDKRSVSYGNTRQKLANTKHRFGSRCCVLGRQKFKNGKHCWEVEVQGELGGSSQWAVGVAKESVERKGIMDFNPQNGIWAVGHNDDGFMALGSSCPSMSPVPWRIWIGLNYPQGLVTFINRDTGAKIFTF
ncbi:BT1A1 protein, partial [Upupa epops]|nr:BT1A1 protein [Upupa epops]